MQTLCKIPYSTSVNFNDIQAAANIASPFSQVVVELPYMVDKAVRTGVNKLVDMIGRPVWFMPMSVISTYNTLPPDMAYTSYAQYAKSTIYDIATNFGDAVGGIAIDHADFYRRFGDLTVENKKFYDGAMLRTQISSAHSFDLPCMVISEHISECLTNMTPTIGEPPHSARWPHLLGGDSSLTDWLVAKNVFYAQTNDEYGAPKSSENFQFTGADGVASRFFESLPVLHSARHESLCVGIVQDVNLSGSAGDRSFGEGATAAQLRFSKGLKTFLTMMDLDGFGIWGSPESLFTPTYKMVDDIHDLPERTSKAQPYSVNGVLYCDYMSNQTPVRIVTNRTFDGFTVLSQ
jgi:hypothetical protein